MRLPLFKTYLPRSLLPRAILILILPLILLQLVVGFVFVQRHFEGVTGQMTRSIAREIAVAQQVIATSPTPEIAQLRLDNLSVPLAVQLTLDPEGRPEPAHNRRWYDWSGRALIIEMTDLLGPEMSVDLASDPRMVDARLQTEKGMLRALIPRTRVTASNPHQLLVLMTVAALVLAAIAILFLRNQMRPILDLADAADAFGKGRSVPFRPSGAEEVRRAGGAFLAMRGRIERQIEQRTQMLSGVSHDLRTPLTRMKLSLAMADGLPEAEEMARDVNAMDQMLTAFLAFARGDMMEETAQVDLPELVEDLASQARRGGIPIDVDIQNETLGDCKVMIRETAVRRALENLISNAAQFGQRIRFGLRILPRSAIFTVEDDGPGIPVSERENVVKPFTRLDSARNLNSGGSVGLGLSIAQDVARSHGGALELADSDDLGGLKAVFRLPR